MDLRERKIFNFFLNLVNEQIFKFWFDISYAFIDTKPRVCHVGKEKQGLNSLIVVCIYNPVSENRLMPSKASKQKKIIKFKL